MLRIDYAKKPWNGCDVVVLDKNYAVRFEIISIDSFIRNGQNEKINYIFIVIYENYNVWGCYTM